MLSPDEEETWDPEIYKMEIKDLMDEGDRIRLEHRREILALRSNMVPLTKRWNEKKDDHDLNMYQEIIQELFADEESNTPYVSKIRSQLCHTLHNHEVKMNQIKISQNFNRKLIGFLTKEIQSLKAESLRREEELKLDATKSENATEYIRQMLEKDVLDQQEEIGALKQNLGINEPKRKGPFIVTPRQSIKKISGSLRNIMARPLSRVETPLILKQSKIWNDLAEQDEKDASEMSKIKKSRRLFLGRFARPPLVGTESKQSEVDDERDEETLVSNRSTLDEKTKGRGSIISTVFGGWENDGSGRFFPTRRSRESSELDREFSIPTISSDLSQEAEGASPDTREDYNKLSEEVFGINVQTLQDS